MVRAVIEHGGIPIPAHADRNTGSSKGLLAVKDNTRKCQLDPNTIRQVMDLEDLLAVEWENMGNRFWIL